MGAATFVEDFKEELEFTPIEGQPNAFLIHPRRGAQQEATQEMSAEDWDKFESDIADAFERVP